MALGGTPGESADGHQTVTKSVYVKVSVILPNSVSKFGYHDVGKILEILEPLPSCLHLRQIHSIKSTQPPSLLSNFIKPPPSVRTSYVHTPMPQNIPCHQDFLYLCRALTSSAWAYLGTILVHSLLLPVPVGRVRQGDMGGNGISRMWMFLPSSNLLEVSTPFLYRMWFSILESYGLHVYGQFPKKIARFPFSYMNKCKSLQSV